MKQRPPILSRLQQRLSRLRSGRAEARAVPAAANKPESFAFSAEIPGGAAGKPLWRLAIEMHSQPQGEGEQLRMRVHWQANLGSSLSLPAPRAGSGGSTAVAERIGGWLRAGLSQPLVRRLAEPLLRQDFNSWMEVRASSADLADGTQALLPEAERLRAFGVELPEGDGPLAQTWAGAAPGPQAGFAQLSLLRLDKRHLPPALAALLGAKPFQLAAAIVNVIEPPAKPR
jgi:hypothetical protein